MGIAMSGMASGMDTQTMITQLMQIEQQPVSLKENEKAGLESEKNAWKSVDTKLTSLKRLAQDFKYASTFGSKIVSTTDETVATATASTSAATTSYVLENIVLAKAGQVTTDSVSLGDGTKANTSSTVTIDANTKFSDLGTISAGTFSINGRNITVEDTDTVNTIVNKINISGAAVEATFDSATNEFKIEQTNAGENYKITFGDSDSSGFLDAVGMGANIGTDITNGVSPDSKLEFDQTTQGVQSGYFTINGYTFEIDETSDTLEGVISKINSSEAGVQAFFDQDTKKVSFVAREAGKNVEIENDTSKFFESLGLLSTGETSKVFEGTKASVTVNGVDFEKESNEFQINGVNIKLKGVLGTGEKLYLDVKGDTEKSIEVIQSFVDKYNEVVGEIEENMKVETSGGKVTNKGVLAGDTTARNLLYSLRNTMTAPISGANTGFNSLAMIGITAEENLSAKLTIDTEKLKEVMESDADAVKKIFNQAAGIENEKVGFGDGTIKEFDLDEIPASTNGMKILAGSKYYTADSSTNKIITSGVPEEDELLVDMLTGHLTFGTAPSSGSEIKAYYSNDDNAGGTAARMSDYLHPYTRFNGTLDTKVKTIDTTIDDMNDWIESMMRRLEMREESYRKQFTAMEMAMSESQSTGSWLSGQLGG